jgi:GT2 family glycosyltransferase
MQLSVIVPNYNGEKTLNGCIQSIYAQDVQLKELILVDDASTDGSVNLVSTRYANVKIIEHEKNQGAARARNNGVKKSSGQILLFVDSDVYLDASCVSEMLKYVRKYDLVYPTVVYEDGTLLSPVSERERTFIRRSPVFLIRKDSLSKLDELFDENYFIYYEDVDFFMRCYLRGLKSRYVENATARHAIVERSTSLATRFHLEGRNRLYCMIKFLGTPKSARTLLLIPTVRDFLRMVRAALINDNIYSGYPDHDWSTKLADSRMSLILLLCEAVIWNISNLRTALIKRKRIQMITRSR